MISIANLIQVFKNAFYNIKILQMEYIFVLLFYLDKFRKTQRFGMTFSSKKKKNITMLCQKHSCENRKREFKDFFLRGNPFRETHSELPTFLPKYKV